MTLRNITDRAGEWLRGDGPRSDVVISSRVRLARNLAGYPFVSKASRRQQHEVLQRCRDQVVSKRLADDVIWVDLSESPATDRQLLVERHLISRQHAAGENRTPRAVAIDAEETWAVMVNEEDHLRLQVLRSGMQLADACAQAQRIDDVLEEKLDFSFGRRFGYLTACPTNVGTGLRVSVMMHLPGLVISREIEKVKRAARDMHLA
ncbi:MAG: ATP--guanido phosphotransferase, partial [Planctomycetota bacterium]